MAWTNTAQGKETRGQRRKHVGVNFKNFLITFSQKKKSHFKMPVLFVSYCETEVNYARAFMFSLRE